MIVEGNGITITRSHFRIRQDGRWRDLLMDEVFDKRCVVLFTLQAPTRSAQAVARLLRFNELACAFRAAGIDSLVCLAEGDPFEVEALQSDCNVQDILMLPNAGHLGTIAATDDNPSCRSTYSGALALLARSGSIENLDRTAKHENQARMMLDHARRAGRTLPSIQLEEARR